MFNETKDQAEVFKSERWLIPHRNSAGGERCLANSVPAVRFPAR